MITGKEIKILDKNSEYFGVPPADLMENAGKKVAKFIISNLKPHFKKTVLFCGTGNNGGDGFVAARYLAGKSKVSVFLTGKEIRTIIAKNNYSKLKKLDINTYTKLNEVNGLIDDNDIIVDAMLGIGLKGELKKPYSTIVDKINLAKNKTIVSVDTPTGLGTNHGLKPDHTITFHNVKEGMNKKNSGDIHIVDIGIPREAADYVGPGELSIYYPKPKKESHKGDNGIILVIGGGPYVGAPALAGLAALRTGADLTLIATPKRSWQPIATFSPNFIVKDLNSEILTNDDLPVIKNLLKKCDSVVLGPGLGDSKKTKDAVKKIVELIIIKNKKLVIDADAIKPVGEQLKLIKNSKIVITPHAGEFKELTGEKLSENFDKRAYGVEQWAKKLGITILLKGPVDIISNGETTKLNKIHNEAMTVGGTGDVLAGIIGALLSKNCEPYNAARIAAFLNGEAGNEAFKKYSYGLLATDIIEEIPTVLKKYLT
jgi:NAD(P)H-hydrate epimerase